MSVARRVGIDRPASTLVDTTNADSPSSGLSPSNARCPPTPEGASAESASLTLGPYPGVPASGNPGEPLVITGTVYDADCVPLPDTRIHVWQTDGDGRYGPGHGTDDLECCYLQGTVRTDVDGRCRLVTTMPGHYEGEARPPPAHIHAEVTSPGGGSVMTEIVFADDPSAGESRRRIHHGRIGRRTRTRRHPPWHRRHRARTLTRPAFHPANYMPIWRGLPRVAAVVRCAPSVQRETSSPLSQEVKDPAAL